MSHTRLTDPQRDVARLNRILQNLDELDSRLKVQNSRIKRLSRDFLDIADQREAHNSNTLTVSWNGPALKFTWTAGYVTDKQEKIYHVPAGEYTGLAAATHYWFAWNPIHQTMSVQEDLSLLTAIPTLIVLFRVHSGDAGTTATAGGGGQESGGSDLTGAKYALL